MDADEVQGFDGRLGYGRGNGRRIKVKMRADCFQSEVGRLSA